jgi:Mn-dependent DtxR family transcriptional regulator
MGVEYDVQQYFRVSPPSVHQMVLTLERAGFIARQPGRPYVDTDFNRS